MNELRTEDEIDVQRCTHGIETWPKHEHCQKCVDAWEALKARTGISDPPDRIGDPWPGTVRIL